MKVLRGLILGFEIFLFRPSRPELQHFTSGNLPHFWEKYWLQGFCQPIGKNLDDCGAGGYKFNVTTPKGGNPFPYLIF